MCGGHVDEHKIGPEATQRSLGTDDAAANGNEGEDDSPPDWENMPLPPDYILAHYLDQTAETYDDVKLGGMAAMGTIPEDQPKVARLGTERRWEQASIDRKGAKGVRVVSCFGYHPWFAHRYTLHPGTSKSGHYTSIFFPPSSPPKSDNARRKREKETLEALLPFYPDPVSFEPLAEGIKTDLGKVKAEGRLGMVGEVGLDGGARVLWPKAARHLYDEDKRALRVDWREVVEARAAASRRDVATGKGQNGTAKPSLSDVDDGWKRLAPFKISMAHQQAILRRQMGVAIELGVPVSLHCVAASGPTMDILKEMRDTYGPRFTNRVNVDLHSGGGWSPEFWIQAAKQLSNLYASPSIYITGRNSNPSGLIRAISPDRMLVESDTHDVTRCTRLVWGATEWIARVKGWELEGDGANDWTAADLVVSEEEWVRRDARRGRGRLAGGSSGDDATGRAESQDREGGLGEAGTEAKETEDRMAEEQLEEPERVWAAKTLERNWARFMGLIEPYE